jgi:phosphatidylglycerophosphate synthase
MGRAVAIAPSTLTLFEAYATLKAAQKPSYGAPAYSRWVNRPVGRVFAAVAYRIGLVPNQVTALSAAFTYCGIALLALVAPSTAWAIVIALLLMLGYALDSADGQVARLTGLGRPSGEWLDHVIDMGKTCLLHGAVAISWFRWGVPEQNLGVWAIAIPVLFLAVSVVAFFGWLLSDLLIRIALVRSAQDAQPPGPTPASQVPAPVLRSLLRLPADYGLLALSFVLFATPLYAPLYALLLVANAVILVAALPVWFRQIRAVEQPS